MRKIEKNVAKVVNMCFNSDCRHALNEKISNNLNIKYLPGKWVRFIINSDKIYT